MCTWVCTGPLWIVRRQKSSLLSLYYEGRLCCSASWVVQFRQYCNSNCSRDMQFAHGASEKTVTIMRTHSVFTLTTAPIFVPLLLSSTAHLDCRLWPLSPWTPHAFHRDAVVLWCLSSTVVTFSTVAFSTLIRSSRIVELTSSCVVITCNCTSVTAVLLEMWNVIRYGSCPVFAGKGHGANSEIRDLELSAALL